MITACKLLVVVVIETKLNLSKYHNTHHNKRETVQKPNKPKF